MALATSKTLLGRDKDMAGRYCCVSKAVSVLFTDRMRVVNCCLLGRPTPDTGDRYCFATLVLQRVHVRELIIEHVENQFSAKSGLDLVGHGVGTMASPTPHVATSCTLDCASLPSKKRHAWPCQGGRHIASGNAAACLPCI